MTSNVRKYISPRLVALMANRGMKNALIAAELGCAPSTVTERLKQAREEGIYVKPRENRNEPVGVDRSLVVKLVVDEGCSYSEVARRLGIAPATVRYHLSEAGVLCKKRRTRAELEAENARLRRYVSYRQRCGGCAMNRRSRARREANLCGVGIG